jgi:hypothetical protein
MESEGEGRLAETLRRAADPRVVAFTALERALSPEHWDDPDELVRAAFLAGWHAGVLWRGGIPGGPDRRRLARRGRRRLLHRPWSVRADWSPDRPAS